MRMKIFYSVICCVLAAPLLLTLFLEGKDKKKPGHTICSATNPQSICSGSNTCGSPTSPCEVDIKRAGGDSASATPDIPNARSNAPFCVKAGTTIIFKSTSKNTGFVLDFGNSSPFDDTAITGGADRPVSVVAKKPGCYTYSIGACTAGTIYGMCGDDAAEFVVTGN